MARKNETPEDSDAYGKRKGADPLTLPVDASGEESVNAMKREIGQRVKAAREALGLTQDQLAAAYGATSNRGLQDNESGRTMASAPVIAALVAKGISGDWVTAGVGNMWRLTDERAAILEASGQLYRAGPGRSAADGKPYGEWAATINVAERFAPVRYYRDAKLSAGSGANNHDHEPDALLFSLDFLARTGSKPENLFLVQVKGDSMHPTLQAGWTVMIDTARRSVSSGIYAIRNGEHEMVKRLESRPGGAIRVISDNRAYQEYEIASGAVDSGDFEVIGQVIWFAGQLA